jgi:hypothetical protein
MNPIKTPRSALRSLRSFAAAFICAHLCYLWLIPSASAQNAITATFYVTNAIQSATNSATVGAVTLTFTNTPAASTDVQISSNLATAASNLKTAFATNSSLTFGQTGYFPGNQVFTLTGLPGAALTASVSGPWGYVTLGTQSVGGVAQAGLVLGGIVITNSGATISNSFTAFNSVAPTNFVTLPSLATLQANPGATYWIRKVDGLTNGLAVTASTGTSIIKSAFVGKDAVTNNFVLTSPGVYGTFAAQEIITNAATLGYTSDGTTNWISH